MINGENDEKREHVPAFHRSPHLSSVYLAAIFLMWYHKEESKKSKYLVSVKDENSDQERKERRSLLTAAGGELASNT